MKRNAFGLIAQLAKTRITLPLIHIETCFRITGDVALVEMDQVFEQTAREPLDVTYTFPLPGGSTVHRCEMIVNERVIRAVVMEEKEARRTVAEKRAAGHRTALMEMDRDNLFTLQLGNTAPGDRIVIRFAYFEVLDRLGAGLSLRIPFCPGIRYIPGKPLLRKNHGLGYGDDTDQVPDASRITPPRIGAGHPDAATIYLHGTLDAGEVDLNTCSSPSHPAIIRTAGDLLEVELAGEQHMPDRDFVLRWEEISVTEAAPRAWVTRHDDHLYALLQIRAPRVEAAQVAGDDFAQDIYFLLDRSGSMSGGNWEKAADALLAFVRELGANDRVWITCFESDFQDFSDSLMSRDDLLADEGFMHLTDIGTAGGTELLPALRHVLDVRTAQRSERPAHLVLITDGQVGNETEIHRLARGESLAGVPVHTFGIDRAVNDAFLKGLARITGGRCALMTPDDDIPAAVKNLAVTLRRPVLTGLRLVADKAETPRESDALPDLHAGDVQLLPVRLPAAESVAIEIRGHHPDRTEWSARFELGADSPGQSNEAARFLWAHRRSRFLLGTERSNEAIEVSITHNLVCKGTSFVAWDEAEKVAVAKREVYQPSIHVERCHSDPPPAARARVMSASACPAPIEKATCGEDSYTVMESACFFDGKVSEQTGPSALRPCSDDELLSDPTPPWEDADPKSELPEPLRNSCDELEERYPIPFDEDFGRKRLTQWAQDFHQALMKQAGLSEPVSKLIVSILRAWALLLMAHHRDARLEALLVSMSASTFSLEQFQQHIEELATGTDGDVVQDALGLLRLHKGSAETAP